MWPYTAEEAEAWPAPRGELASRVLAMPGDTNSAGDIFGGWIMSQMDSAGATTASHHVEGKVATVAVSDLAFHYSVKVGDTVCCYASLVRVGRTSLTYHIEAWVKRAGRDARTKVTQAEFTFVGVDADGEPRLLPASTARRLEAAVA